MDGRASLETVIAPVVEGMGYALVRVQSSGGRRPVVQVMAERIDGRPMSVADCASLSRTVSARLDVEDPIAGSYILEVSSPGIDRPLVRPADFRRYAGQAARVETRLKIGGRRRFSGRILGAGETHLRLALDDPPAPIGGEVEIAFADIRSAKLEFTDDLISAASPRRGPGHPRPPTPGQR